MAWCRQVCSTFGADKRTVPVAAVIRGHGRLNASSFLRPRGQRRRRRQQRGPPHARRTKYSGRPPKCNLQVPFFDRLVEASHQNTRRTPPRAPPGRCGLVGWRKRAPLTAPALCATTHVCSAARHAVVGGRRPRTRLVCARTRGARASCSSGCARPPPSAAGRTDLLGRVRPIALHVSAFCCGSCVGG